MGEILLAGKEPDVGPALLRDVVTDSAAQHRKFELEPVEDRSLRHLTLHFELYLAFDPRQRPQMSRKHDSDHGSVCTSTESTGGKSRTIGCQLSPESGDAYTWPPVVPKYTPQDSSESI